MTEQAQAQPEFKKKRFRSPPYPFIGLGKAIERAEELHKNALHHPVPLHVPASAWNYTTKSSGLGSTIAALKQFGLLRDEGSGDKRRFTLTDSAIRIIKDPDPKSEKRREALKRAALTPKIHSELWEKFGIAGLNSSMDVAIKSYLTLDRKDGGEAPYSDNAAQELVDGYRATMAFADLSNSDILSGLTADESDSNNLLGRDEPDQDRFGGAKIGDLVQWEVDGVLKLEKPLRVRKVITHEGQDWVYVETSKAAIPMSQVVVESHGEGGGMRFTQPPFDFEPDPGAQAWREVTDLDEGTVVLTLPEKLSADSYADLEAWMKFILRKARRRAGVPDPEKNENKD